MTPERVPLDDAPRAWLLNLDADVELARGSATYTPTTAVRAAMQPHVARFAKALLREGDLLVDEDTSVGSAAGFAGLAFCPTPRAVRLLRRAGALVEAPPSESVLRQVNSRAFCASLGQTLPGATFAEDAKSVLAHLANPPPLGSRWRVKRSFGMAGRGQRSIAPGPLTSADEAFLRAALAEGGVQIEPEVAILLELGLHGMLARDGLLLVGALVEQSCDPRGQWLSTQRASLASCAAWGEAVATEARAVAVALHAAGYFGPFGIDAFVYEHEGVSVLQPRSEINARFAMGFPVGFAF